MTTTTDPEADWANLDLPAPKQAMPVVGDWMVPWIAVTFGVAVLTVTYVVGGNQLPMLERSLLAISLCATLTSAVLVVIRSRRTRDEGDREERARPAAEALDGAGVQLGSAAYVEGMRDWTAAVLELLDHSCGQVEVGSALATDLEAALADTRELWQLLEASADGSLSLHEAATIHAVCSLWESNQARLEQLAASCDPGWHRHWRARTVTERNLRHGGTIAAPLVIPYRT